ncbi:5-bromo-4-chloroindolyl phosphate hydrolysis family protein [Frigidibacter sp. MR17.24]|uniref:5-bromo-4-chloroindolyl phosphate hydrolysis family protein n=1 Tax=Frigidibacter sp. MR17.24 TaxID=3127345 RepID=UPI003012EFB8
MAERFGGPHSPGGDPRASARTARGSSAGTGRRLTARTPEPMRARRNLLFLAPLPLVFAAFSGGALDLVTDLAALAALWGGAYLTSEGVKAEAAFNARTFARRPAIPRKLFGMALTGLGTAGASLAPTAAGGADLVAPVIFGAIAALLHVVAFGTDPWRDRRPGGIDDFQHDRVARALQEAERQLARISAAIAGLGDRQLAARVAGFETTARAMFARIESDPRDLTAARRYLGVYLEGAAEASEKLARLSQAGGDAGATARADYIALLDDLEANYAARTEALLGNDRGDLGVEIGVLRDRLSREGLREGVAARRDDEME